MPKQPPAGLSSIQQRVFESLSNVDRPGTFYSYGSSEPVLPGLEIDGIGQIALPLLDSHAELIRQHCVQAPYGKGEQTIVDTDVRRVWQMAPEQFRLKNPGWQDFLFRILKNVETDLGLEDQGLVPEIYNLLLYEKGSFFLPHRDSEKLDKMVATLVVILPSAFRGGELIVSHEKERQIIDFGSQDNSSFLTHYAAFYADCEHEVKPLREGYRLCLTYNLVLGSSKKSFKAPSTDKHISAISSLLREWSDEGINNQHPEKFAITLEHQYTQNGLAWERLKGIDRSRVKVIREAARQAKCKIHLAQLTYWEHGSAYDYDDTGGWRRGRSGTTNEPGSYKMEEVFDSALTAGILIDDSGDLLKLERLALDEEEIAPEGAIRTGAIEEEYEGYTGNAGETLERWYRNAAILLWPEWRHFSIISSCGTRDATNALLGQIQKWSVCKDSKQQTVLKEQCVQLARVIISDWEVRTTYKSFERDYLDEAYTFDNSDDDDDDDDDETDFDAEEDDDEEDDEDDFEDAYSHKQAEVNDDNSKPQTFVDALEQLDDAELIREFLDKVVTKDHSVELDLPLIAACEKHGWSVFKSAFEKIFQSTTALSVLRNGRLLEVLSVNELPENEERRKLCMTVSEILFSTLKTIDKVKSYHTNPMNRTQLLTRMIKSLIAIAHEDQLEKLASYTLANSEKYPPKPVLITTLLDLEDWLAVHANQTLAMSKWISACVKDLEVRSAKKPQEPKDFKRDADVSCTCADCKELVTFLKNPAEASHRFRVRKDRREHLHRMIERHHCDLYHVTERKGSPQTLVCTKNINSFHQKLKTFTDDLDSLAALRKLGHSLISGRKRN